MNPNRIVLVCCALLLLSVCGNARAGCGSAVCSVNTNWDSQGTWTEPGMRLDLRFEFIDQDQPMSGSQRVAVGEIPRHHDEVRTINRNWVATLDYAFDDRFGVSFGLPVFDRSHSHIHNHLGVPEPEAWNYSEIGDARILGRFNIAEEHHGAHGLLFGVKLPTGSYKVENQENERAERTLQPGSGTTDVLLGAYYQYQTTGTDSWFMQALWQSALGSREDFRPGDRLGIDVGYRHPLGERIAVLLQINLLQRNRDSGDQSDPEDSGGRSVFVSPGLSARVSDNSEVYGFVQLPVYQYVNGVQLTSAWSLVAGFATNF
ncbi:MAG: transporter [Burkholderiales bacterium]